MVINVLQNNTALNTNSKSGIYYSHFVEDEIENLGPPVYKD